MRRQFPYRLSLAAVALTGGALTFTQLNSYTHPDNLAERSTEDLYNEAISLTTDHTTEPFFVQWVRFQRQDYISQELRNRRPEFFEDTADTPAPPPAPDKLATVHAPADDP